MSHSSFETMDHVPHLSFRLVTPMAGQILEFHFIPFHNVNLFAHCYCRWVIQRVEYSTVFCNGCSSAVDSALSRCQIPSIPRMWIIHFIPFHLLPIRSHSESHPHPHRHPLSSSPSVSSPRLDTRLDGPRCLAEVARAAAACAAFAHALYFYINTPRFSSPLFSSLLSTSRPFAVSLFSPFVSFHPRLAAEQLQNSIIQYIRIQYTD